MSMDGKTVLVTGGSGFLGGWVVQTLLGRGYRVRTTMRSHKREAELRQALGEPDRLEVAVADLTQDAGWEHAMAGVAYVQHVASPMPVGEFRGQDITTPARDGTLRVLRAAQKAGVTRVVLTSSGVAALPDCAPGHVYTELDWTDPAKPRLSEYARAKTLAEQDAWAFVANSRSSMTLTTILPGAIQGPLLTPDLAGWADFIMRMLAGKMPFLPRVGMSMVDVRDLAELHVRAMEAPAAGGQRFLAAAEFVWFAEAAQILRDELGDKASKVKTRVAPDSLIRFLALFNADLRQLVPTLGLRKTMSAAKAGELLDWHARPIRQSLTEAGTSILAMTLRN
jgi:nucleoside-diphosphate-sugar epimerase